MEVVKLLIARGARMKEFTYSNTALDYAAEKGNLEIVSILIGAGNDVSALNVFLQSPFSLACGSSLQA